MQDNFAVTGWETGNFFIRNFENLYKTNFGMQSSAGEEKYSNVTFGVELSRPKEYLIWKLLLPLIIVLISSLGAGFIFPGYIDARIYAPIGALLTAVFLQQSYTGSLPEISYLILMDKIYVVAYLVIIAGIIQAIATANIVKDEEEEQFARVRKIDRIFLVISLTFFFVTSSILILTT